MSDLDKKIVTYEAMEKYTAAMKQYIANNSGNTGSGVSDYDLSKLTHSLGLPIGNTGAHTWENMCIEGDTEEQHVGSVRINYYDEEYGDYYNINGTYFNVCPFSDHDESGGDNYYVLLIGTNSPATLTPDESETIGHATDASLIALNIFDEGESVIINFDIPIKTLGSSNGYEIPEYTINSREIIDVMPNTSVVVNLEDSDFSSYCEINLEPPTRPGYVYEYRIVLKDEWGGYREIMFNTPWGGIIYWANDDAPYFDNEHNSSATYEINIKLHIDTNDIEYDDSNNTISSCSCNLWGTYTKYRWS